MGNKGKDPEREAKKRCLPASVILIRLTTTLAKNKSNVS
jgi:hypothetical protein